MFEMFDLKNKTAVITGGAGFLGVKHAEALLESNAHVVLVDINKEILEEKIATLSKHFPQKIYGYVIDITDEKQVEAGIKKIIAEVGNIDILINNAANNPAIKKEGGINFSRLENFSKEVWEKDIAVGLTGAYLMSKYVGQNMVTRKNGVILNIASDLGIIAPNQKIYRKEGLPENEQPVKPITYSIVKHALIGLTKYLATYWADQGIRVNSVSFGGVYKDQPEDFLHKLHELIPLGRMAHADEYKGAIVFLCSEASSYMTGSNLIIDGGRTCW